MAKRMKKDRPRMIYVVMGGPIEGHRCAVTFHKSRAGAALFIHEAIWEQWDGDREDVPDGCPHPKDWKNPYPWVWENSVSDYRYSIVARTLEP